LRYTFEWDLGKAKTNVRKHGISLERATEVFLDPLAISTVDQEHTDSDSRWITIGLDKQGVAIVLVHTFNEDAAGESTIRLISARRATRRELKQYEELEK